MKPILFNTDMVRANLQGRKTQTRRIVKFSKKIQDPQIGFSAMTEKGMYEVRGIHESGEYGASFFKLPYEKNDILYVRETWAPALGDYAYRADYSTTVLNQPQNKGLWKPSIHMPKKAARLFLRVTNIKIERLQNITEDDAKKEGVAQWLDGSYKAYTKDAGKFRSARNSFRTLWDSVYGDIADWDSNPYVFVIEFEKINSEL